MGYQLVVWEGEKPETDAAAGAVCQELMDRYYVSEGVEPTPAIREFVAALTEVWTDDWEDPAWDESPWKFPPIINDASGPLVFLNMRFGMGERAAFVIAEMAQERGLVTFDTYVEVMRPCPTKVIEDWNRQAWQHVWNLAEKVGEEVPRLANGEPTTEYQLVVWEGERPENDEAGERACRDIANRFRDERIEPTPAIREFVEALTQDWPDDPADPAWQDSPWLFPSILDGASGPALFLKISLGVGVFASCVVAAMAEERGLVTYDPQVAKLRPVSQDVIDEYERRWNSALN